MSLTIADFGHYPFENAQFKRQIETTPFMMPMYNSFAVELWSTIVVPSA